MLEYYYGMTDWQRRRDLFFRLDDDSADPDVDGLLSVLINGWTMEEQSTGRAMPQVVAAANFAHHSPIKSFKLTRPHWLTGIIMLY